MSADRYKATGAEAQWQEGSSEQVLRNKLGICDPGQMHQAELELLQQLYEHVLLNAFPNRRLDVADIRQWHGMWLGNLYDWAGRERGVNIGKGGFQFAAATQIPWLLREFEKDVLHRWTPCHAMDEESLVQAIAMCHVELILIHPFREGNGRISRLLADVMAVQAGREPLDYSVWDSEKPVYIAAIQQGMGRDYSLMETLVSRALRPVAT